MTHPWTTDSVLQLSTSTEARKKVLELAAAQRWKGLFASPQPARYVWGQIHGSADEPYLSMVDPAEPAFRCTCPSKKNPCKHALALLLLSTRSPEHFTTAHPPSALTDWIHQRQQAAQNKRAKPQPTQSDLVARAKKAAIRAAQRDQKILNGINTLELRLFDLLKQGLASAQAQPADDWMEIARTMINAQAPGLARRVRAMESAARAGSNGQSHLLDEMARLYLCMQAYRRLNDFPPALRADIRSAVGWEQRQKDLDGLPGLSDDWLVLGRSCTVSTRLTIQRTWLVGSSSLRSALLLSFMHDAPTPLDNAPLGQMLPAEVVFYTSAYPLRAEIRARGAPAPLPEQIPASPSIQKAVGQYSAALACNPWIERFPLALQRVTPVQVGEGWFLLDEENRAVPLQNSFAQPWTLLAISGGQPLGVFGEWNSRSFLPLSAWNDSGFHAFAPILGDRIFDEE